MSSLYISSMGAGRWVHTKGLDLFARHAVTALQIGGPIHRMITAAAPDEREELVRWFTISDLRRCGHRRHLPQLREGSDEDAIRATLRLLESSTADTPRMLLSDLASARLVAITDEGVELLGDRHEYPSADDLEAMADRLADQHPVLAIRTMLALVVECRMPARDSVRELDARGSRFAPRLGELASTGAVTPMVVPPSRPSESTRDARRQRREIARLERQKRRAQGQAEAALRRNRRTAAATSRHTTEQGSVDRQVFLDIGLVVERLTHPQLGWPHVHRGVDLVSDPVGRLGVAYLWWGDGRRGKHRPVIVIGADPTYVWVRGVHTRDLAAGLWRAVVIRDWRELGLDHESFVSIDVYRVRRSRVDLRSTRMTDHDWNRLCRGEVH